MTGVYCCRDIRAADAIAAECVLKFNEEKVIVEFLIVLVLMGYRGG